jgi:phosphinothricin acetyltransferase
VYLAHQHIGQGLGKQLYQVLLEDLRQRNVHTVIGGIAQPNPTSVALHEKLGFEKAAHFKEVGYKFDQWIDVAYWQLTLK